MNLKYTETLPKTVGYYWLKRGQLESVVHVSPQKKYGNKLCALLGLAGLGLREWIPVEQLSNSAETVLWAGPIQHPED